MGFHLFVPLFHNFGEFENFAHDVLPYLALFIAGTLLGSFLNCCIYRLPRQISLLTKVRSFCPHCLHNLAWWQNIPLVSFLLLRTKCYYCRQGISWQYPVVELLTGLLTVLLYAHLGLTPELALFLLFFYGLIVVSAIDLEHRIIPNQLLAALLIPGLLLNSFLLIIPWHRILFSALAGGVLLFTTRIVGSLILQKTVMGMGDVKLAVVLAMFIGWQPFLLALFIASCLAIIFSITIKFFSLRICEPNKIPFAPFLSIGCLVAALWSTALWEWHQHLFFASF